MRAYRGVVQRGRERQCKCPGKVVVPTRLPSVQIHLLFGSVQILMRRLNTSGNAKNYDGDQLQCAARQDTLFLAVDVRRWGLRW